MKIQRFNEVLTQTVSINSKLKSMYDNLKRYYSAGEFEYEGEEKNQLAVLVGAVGEMDNNMDNLRSLINLAEGIFEATVNVGISDTAREALIEDIAKMEDGMIMDR